MKRFGFVAGLRLMLWWGARTLRGLVRTSEKQKIIRLMRSSRWADSVWCVLDKRSVCLTFEPETRRITIVVVPFSVN